MVATNLGRVRIEFSDALFTLSNHDLSCQILSPVFEVDGVERGPFTFVEEGEHRDLLHGGQEVELRYRAEGEPNLNLIVTVRSYPESAVLRLRYTLTADIPCTLSKQGGRDRLTYLAVTGAWRERALTEIQLSHFEPVVHSYLPHLETRAVDDVGRGTPLVGPIVVLHGHDRSLLIAYEHGADHPQSFLEYTLSSDGHVLSLDASKGNYYDGQPLGPDVAWTSVWLELALLPGPLDDMLRAYRHFVLHEMAENLESRRPYLYYNTWNYQERVHYFERKPYLEPMHQERIMAEIDVAHRLGIDVFVIDTGWYGKTGDWLVNTDRFPDGLKAVKAKLDAYGMKMGLWFNPIVAALTSAVYTDHPEYEMTRGGQPHWRGPIWETEESTNMCLVSDYADFFIETLVRLYRELGVSYFKWDAIGQYGCDSPLHHHGTEANAPEERADCYAFMMGNVMIRIVEAVTQRCPDAIVDFDITESGRFVGLGFLAVGKYFLVNNGPYFHDFDLPKHVTVDPDTINVFFYPGAARPRVCRQGIRYDGVIPSILFLTHYLPDPPTSSQRNSVASLVLGGNGIWGDLLALDEADVANLSEHLVNYKQVAEAVTRAYPRRRGFIGSSPEVHEKLEPETASGLVVFLTVTPCTVTHLTQPLQLGELREIRGADHWKRTPEGRLEITVNLERNDARVVYVLGRAETLRRGGA
jgi:alpha-galactosidase